MLGSAADAEDVLQESWLRWAAVDRREVREPRAYLVRIVTRQALNHLRTVARRREDYVGEWLPEPLLTSPDVADDVELAENLSIAMLTVLETLGPAERAVFVLREVFDVPYDEIADAVGKTPAAVRQIAHRAKEHVSARRPRVTGRRSEHEEVVERLVAGAQHRRPPGAHGRPRARRGLGRRRRRQGPRRGAAAGRRRRAAGAVPRRRHGEGRGRAASPSPTRVNGQPAIRMELDGQLVGVASVTVEHGRVTRIYTIANPDKLSRLDAETTLSR